MTDELCKYVYQLRERLATAAALAKMKQFPSKYNLEDWESLSYGEVPAAATQRAPVTPPTEDAARKNMEAALREPQDEYTLYGYKFSEILQLIRDHEERVGCGRAGVPPAPVTTPGRDEVLEQRIREVLRDAQLCAAHWESTDYSEGANYVAGRVLAALAAAKEPRG